MAVDDVVARRWRWHRRRQRRRDQQAVLHDLYSPSRQRHRARSARRREGPRYHAGAGSAGAPGFHSQQRNFCSRRFRAASANCATGIGARSTATSRISTRRGKSRPAEVFMTAPSPAILTRFIINLHYPNEDAYVAAFANVMRALNIARSSKRAFAADRCPRPRLGPEQPVSASHRRRFPPKIAERNVAALNAATAGLPAERMRCTSAGELRGPAHPRSAAPENHRYCFQGAAAGDQHRGRQPAPRSRMGGPQGEKFPTTRSLFPA